MTALKRVRQRCEARVRELDIRAPLDVRELCNRLELTRGRRIVLCAVNTNASPCGVWMAGKATDYIFYEQDTSRLHQDHIILHEVGHLLSSHVPARVLNEEWTQLLLPNLDGEMVRRVLGRTTYSAEEEQEAEMIASLILERAGSRWPTSERTVEPDVAEALDRLESALSDPERSRRG